MLRILFVLLIFESVYVLGPSPSQASLMTPQDEAKLTAIIEKMKNNDPLTSAEQNAFNVALKSVKNKIQNAGGKRTTLTTFESKIYNQDVLNQVKPTIAEILESGKRYKWGLDLTLVEQRGATARTLNVGGEDVTSYITTFQKVKTNPQDPRYTVALNKILKVSKLSKEQIESLPVLTQQVAGSDLDKVKVDTALSVNKCKCLADLVEQQVKIFPQKKGIFTKARFIQPEVYDQVNAMKVNANLTMTRIKKEIELVQQSTQPLPSHVTASQQKIQEDLNKLNTSCLKSFTDLSNEVKKLSNNKIILNDASCTGVAR